MKFIERELTDANGEDFTLIGVDMSSEEIDEISVLLQKEKTFDAHSLFSLKTFEFQFNYKKRVLCSWKELLYDYETPKAEQYAFIIEDWATQTNIIVSPKDWLTWTDGVLGFYNTRRASLYALSFCEKVFSTRKMAMFHIVSPSLVLGRDFRKYPPTPIENMIWKDIIGGNDGLECWQNGLSEKLKCAFLTKHLKVISSNTITYYPVSGCGDCLYEHRYDKSKKLNPFILKN